MDTPAPQTGDDLLREILTLLQTHGSIAAASRATGIPRETLRGRQNRVREQFPGLLPTPVSRPDWAAGLTTPIVVAEVVKPIAAPAPPPPAPPVPEDPVKLRRAYDRIGILEKEVRNVTGTLIDTQDKLAQVLRLRDVAIPEASWLTAPAITKQTILLPALFSSDFQVGEVIKSSEIDGINEYNCDVFAERYKALIERTIDIATHHTGNAEFPGIFYLRGGDAISGGIHEELAETDELSAVPAVRFLMQHEREGIRQLRAAFGRVKVISIPGNHGRNKKDRVSKGYTDHSYETLLTWWLETQFEGDPNVTFQTPVSGDAYFDMLGWKMLMSHGDRTGSRGGAGFVGPAATIARGHQKLLMNYNMTGRPVHCILTGHLHTSLKLSTGYANGSVAGYGEFARDIRASPDAAKQWLLFLHEKRMVAQAFEVQLSSMPRRTMTSD